MLRRCLPLLALVACSSSSTQGPPPAAPVGASPSGPAAYDEAVAEPGGAEAQIGVDAPVDVAAPPAEATVTGSGLAHLLVRPGAGTRHPAETDSVTVHYSGWTPDGRLFDSSVSRGETATFPLNGVIEGWTEGVQLMREGEIRRFWIPGALAYGDHPRPGAPAGDLVFDVELVRIE